MGRNPIRIVLCATFIWVFLLGFLSAIWPPVQDTLLIIPAFAEIAIRSFRINMPFLAYCFILVEIVFALLLVLLLPAQAKSRKWEKCGLLSMAAILLIDGLLLLVLAVSCYSHIELMETNFSPLVMLIFSVLELSISFYVFVEQKRSLKARTKQPEADPPIDS